MVASAAGALGAVLGAVILVGWLTQTPALQSLGMDGKSMNPVSAVCLLALGAAVLVAARTTGARTQDGAGALALAAAMVAAARLTALLLDESPAVDELLFVGPMVQLSMESAPRMTPDATVCFLLLGVGVLFHLRATRGTAVMTQLFSMAVLFVAQATLVASAYQMGWLEAAATYERMSVASAVGFAALSLGLMALSSNGGLIPILRGDGPAGALSRVLLPAAFLVPALAGSLIIRARRDGFINSELADSLLVISTMVVFVGFVAWVATMVHESHLSRIRAEEALRESEERFRLIAENGTDVVSLLEPNGRVLYVSPSCERLVGFRPEELLRMEPMALIHPEDVPRMERHASQLLRGEPVTSIQVRMLHKTGRHVWLDMMWRAVTGRDGEVTGLQVSSRDITERKQYEKKLEEAQRVLKSQQRELEEVNGRLKSLASTDGLTGIKNRRAFEERLEQEVSRAHRYGHPVSLLLVDVDHFKAFNDRFGHPKGDEVLRTVGRLLTRAVRSTDFVARYGGEEFAVILPSTEVAQARELAERLRAAVEEAVWADREITVSVGVASFSERVGSSEELIAEADRALYFSKKGGRNRVSLAVGPT